MSGKLAFVISSMNGPRSGQSRKLYRLEPPIDTSIEYVISSAVDAPDSGPETYLFQANADGEITNWSELHGSFRGGKNCDQAIENAGYTVVEPERCLE